MPADPRYTQVPLTVTFTAFPSGNRRYDYDWRFGDGATSGRHPVHTYDGRHLRVLLTARSGDQVRTCDRSIVTAASCAPTRSGAN